MLEAEEFDARAAASLWLTDDGHGQTHGRFTLPTLCAEILRKHLQALCAPKHRATEGLAPFEPGTPSRHKLGEAFCAYLETRPDDTVPHAGGVLATVVVTMTEQSLEDGLAAASPDTGHRLSAAEARRLACRAGIIPAVLGSHSTVLDLGRKTHHHTEPQRIALALRDRGCTTEGCDAPPPCATPITTRRGPKAVAPT